MNIMKLADELLLGPFRAQVECDECHGTGWRTRKEDDAPIMCFMCDAHRKSPEQWIAALEAQGIDPYEARRFVSKVVERSDLPVVEQKRS